MSAARFCPRVGVACLLLCSGCAEDSVLSGLPPDTRNVPSTCATQAGIGFVALNDFDGAQQANFSFYANPDDGSGTVCGLSGCGRYPHVGESGPDPGAPVEAPPTPETAACRAGNAVHLQGGGYITYGPNFGWSVGTSSTDALDVSQFSGLSFWGKAGSSAPAGESIQVMLYDTTTFPVADQAARRCVEAVGGSVPATGTGCYNGGHAERTLGDNGIWHLYTLDFSEFKEETWGAQSPHGRPDLSHLMRVEIKLPLNDSFDVWLDNFAWFTR